MYICKLSEHMYTLILIGIHIARIYMLYNICTSYTLYIICTIYNMHYIYPLPSHLCFNAQGSSPHPRPRIVPVYSGAVVYGI